MKKLLFLIIGLLFTVVILLGVFVHIPIESNQIYECLYWEPGNQNIIEKSVEIKRIHYYSILGKDYEKVSISIDNNSFSESTFVEKLENGISIASINRLKCSNENEYYRWATVVFDGDKFNISTDGDTITWEHKFVKKPNKNIYKGNNSLFVNSINITTATNKEEIIDFINNIYEKNDTGESISSELVVESSRRLPIS